MTYDNETLNGSYSYVISCVDRHLNYTRGFIKKMETEKAVEEIEKASKRVDEHIYLFEEKDFPKCQNEKGTKIIGIHPSHFKRIESLFRKINKVERMLN